MIWISYKKGKFSDEVSICFVFARVRKGISGTLIAVWFSFLYPRV